MGYNEMLSAMDMEIQTPYFKDAFDKMPEYVKAMMRALLRGLELVTNDGVDDFNRVSIDFNEYVYEVGARRYPFQSVKELAKAALARIFVEFDMWLFGAWIDLWDDDHLYTDKKGRTRIYYMFTKRFASMMLHCKDTVMGEEINPDDYKYPIESTMFSVNNLPHRLLNMKKNWWKAEYMCVVVAARILTEMSIMNRRK